MAKFCGKCGSHLDAATGLCPNCDREKLNPVVNNRVPEPPVKKSSKKEKSKGLSVTVTVLLSICLFVTSFLSVLIYDVRNAVKEDNLEKFIENVSATDVVYGIKVADDGVMERFYNYLERKFKAKITDRKLNNFVEESTVKSFIIEKTADFCEDFFDGDAELIIKKKEIVSLLQKNSREINEEFGIVINDENVREIADLFFNGSEAGISSDMIKDKSPVLYYGLTIGLSYGTMAVLILLSALIIFFMFRNSVAQAACGIGFVFTVIGGITALIAMLAVWITPLWETIWAGSFIGVLVGRFMEVNAFPSIILMLVGILMLVLGAIVKRVRSAKSKG